MRILDGGWVAGALGQGQDVRLVVGEVVLGNRNQHASKSTQRNMLIILRYMLCSEAFFGLYFTPAPATMVISRKFSTTFGHIWEVQMDRL